MSLGLGDGPPTRGPLDLRDSRLLLGMLVGASIALRVLFLASPFELHGASDFHGLAQRMLGGELPYRDFTFEYPVLAAPIVLVSGLVPAAWSASALAAESLLAEACMLLLLRADRVALRRYLLLTLPLVPLLSGGFDAFAMLAIGAALLLSGSTTRAAPWAASAGALVKLFPAVWFAVRRPARRDALPVVVMAAGLLIPLVVAPFDSTYLGFALHRGVYLGAVPASVHALATWAQGLEVTTQFGFGNLEQVGAGPTAMLTLAGFGLLGVMVVVRSWRARSTAAAPDSVLVTHALLLCALCAGKVLSPQYVLVAVPSAAILGGRRAVAWGVIGVMTILPFSSYSRDEGFMAAMALRNLVLVVETLAVARLVLRGSTSRPPELEPPGAICSDGRT